jgi:hypothetical protein
MDNIYAILTHHYGKSGLVARFLQNHPEVQMLGEPLNKGSIENLKQIIKRAVNKNKVYLFTLMYPQMDKQVVKLLKNKEIKVVQVHGQELNTDHPYVDDSFIKKVKAWKNSYKHLAQYTLEYTDYKPSKDNKWRNYHTRKPFLKFLGVEDKRLEL